MGDGETTGFTRYVTTREFETHSKKNDEEHHKIEVALWGENGRGGMVKDINDLKLWIKIGGIIIGILSPVVTAYLVKILIGG